MARRSTPKRAPKRRSRAKRKPKGFWPRFGNYLAHHIVRLRLDKIFLGAFVIFALGIALGLVFSELFPGDKQVTKRSGDGSQYRVPVTVIDDNAGQTPAAQPQASKPKHQPKRVARQPPKPTPKRPAATATKPSQPPQHTAKKPPLTKKSVLPKQTKPRLRQQSAAPGGTVPWLQNAVRSPAIGDRPAIAIVLDDLGIDQRRTKRAIALPSPLTLALIPYGYNLAKHATQARARGHELLVHLPMEPLDPEANPGRNALLTSLTENELRRRLNWNLAQFKGFVGVNNHMGSKFTAWGQGMEIVIQTLRHRGLMFLDSKTTKNSQGYRLARRLRVPHTVRDVFLDNNITEEAIEQQLRQLENVARRNGSAIGIGHPHDETVSVLRRWIPAARKKGFVLVPVTAIVRRKPLSG